jgi:hypothetical protein
MSSDLEKEYIIMLQEMYMLDNGLMIYLMVMEHIYLHRGSDIKDNLKKERNMVMGYTIT